MGRSDIDPVAQTEALLAAQGIDLQTREIVIAYDKDGPLTRHGAMDLYPEVAEVVGARLQERNGVLPVLCSGWDVQTLQYLRDEVLERNDFGIIGGLGAEAVLDDDPVSLVDDPMDGLYDVKQQIYMQAAVEGRKISEQGDNNPVKACTKVEAEGRPGDERGHLYANPVAADADTAQLYADLNQLYGDGFALQDGIITFDPDDREAIIATHTVLTQEQTSAGVRFNTFDNGTIGFYRDPVDADIALSDAHSFIDRALDGTEWVPDHNPDWGSDYVKQETDISKESGLNTLAQHYFGTDDPDDYVLFMVGDKPSDYLEADNAITFGQIHGEIADWCETHGKPYVPIENGADYTETVDTVLQRAGYEPVLF